MTEPTETPEDKISTKTERAKAAVKKTAEVADKASNVAEVANNAFGMVKWVAIAITALVVLSLGWGAYNMVSKPVEVVSNAAASVTEAAGNMAGKVSDGASAVKDSAAGVLNRLQIPATDQARVDGLAETAFPILFKMKKTRGSGVKEPVFRSTNFPGSNGHVCKMSLNFGGGEIVTYVAADIDDHKTEASLGSKNDRLIRMVIRAEDDDIKMNTYWDAATESWILKWKSTTVRKPLGDKVAEARLLDVLAAVPINCR